MYVSRQRMYENMFNQIERKTLVNYLNHVKEGSDLTQRNVDQIFGKVTDSCIDGRKNVQGNAKRSKKPLRNLMKRSRNLTLCKRNWMPISKTKPANNT